MSQPTDNPPAEEPLDEELTAEELRIVVGGLERPTNNSFGIILPPPVIKFGL